MRMNLLLGAGFSALLALALPSRAETVLVPNNAPWAFQQGDKTVGVLVSVV